MKLHPFSLSFSQDLKGMEQEFLKDYFNNYLSLFRVCHFFSIFFYGMFGIADILAFPEQKYFLLFIRFGIVIPVFLIGFALTFHRNYIQFWPLLNNFYVVVTGAGFIAMMAYCPAPLSYSYYAGVIVCLVFGYTFIRSRFLMASLAGLTLFAAFVIVSLAIGTPREILIVHFAFMLVVSILGMLICYSTEISARKDFFLRNLLEQEKEKVKDINGMLENRIMERTEKLIQSNQLLTEEIRERKSLESRLVQSQKMEALGRLAGGIAHDFNNILNPIIGYTEMSMDCAEPDSLVKKNLEETLRAANRAQELVSQILTFSREAGQEKKSIQVQPVIREVVELLSASIPPGIRIRQTIDENAGPVLANEVQVHQVLMNLCTNASHAMGEREGTMDIRLQERWLEAEALSLNPGPGTGIYLELIVGDTGHGMEPEVAKRVFDPYFTTKAPDRGTGMGLAVVHGIVKDLQGEIRVESEPGKGSVFHVYLPVHQGADSQILTASNPCPETQIHP